MADELKEALLRLALMTKGLEERSGADRLRPPYTGPLRGLDPATAGSSRDVEVGYNNLPAPYQRALQAAPVRQARVGTFPPGYNLKGLTRKANPETGGVPLIVGDTAGTMTHELVHEMQVRRGDPLGVDAEALARLVAGDTGLGGVADRPDAREAAKIQDAKLRAEFPDPALPSSSGWSGWLDTLGRLLGR